MGSEARNNDFVTHQQLNKALDERDGKWQKQIDKLDEIIDDMRVSQGVTHNELKHINRNGKETNEALKQLSQSLTTKFDDMQQVFAEGQSEQDQIITQLQDKWNWRKLFWPIVGTVLVSGIGFVGTIFTVFGDNIAKALFGQ
jgi:predicted  nucleic acid-binding Zn-ribbon protein